MPLVTGDQILCHLIGDYLLQSDWMASQKTKRWIAALLHAGYYSFPFLWFLGPSNAALLTIFLSHALIDRYRLARYVVWAKNCLGPNPPWAKCRATGYPPDRPEWLTVWLLIIADNTIHIALNGLALKYL